MKIQLGWLWLKFVPPGQPNPVEPTVSASSLQMMVPGCHGAPQGCLSWESQPRAEGPSPQPGYIGFLLERPWHLLGLLS